MPEHVTSETPLFLATDLTISAPPEVQEITTQAQMIVLAEKILRTAGVPFQIWEPSDMDDYLLDYRERDREAIRERAQQDWAWTRLGEATDEQWDSIADAVSASAGALGILTESEYEDMEDEEDED
jgi:hypothetical protein